MQHIRKHSIYATRESNIPYHIKIRASCSACRIMMSLTTTITTIALCMLTSSALGCSMVKPPPHYSMEELLYEAPIVIYGKDTGHLSTNDDNMFDLVFFEVYCIFKDNTNTIKTKASNITLSGEYLVHSCMNTHTQEGKEYIIALEALQTDMFAPWEPDVLNAAQFEPTSSNLKKVVSLCGLQNVTDTGLKPNVCPKSLVVGESCKQAKFTGDASHLCFAPIVLGLVCIISMIFV